MAGWVLYKTIFYVRLVCTMSCSGGACLPSDQVSSDAQACPSDSKTESCDPCDCSAETDYDEPLYPITVQMVKDILKDKSWNQVICDETLFHAGMFEMMTWLKQLHALVNIVE